MNSKVEKQHFVPQFILRNFSISNNKQLWVFDKLRGVSYLASIRDTASKKNYYEINKESIELNTEEILSEIESDCAPILMKIINESSVSNISDNEHSKICLFTALQYLRTNKTRDQLEQINKLMAKRLKKDGHSSAAKEFNSSKSEIKEITSSALYSASLDVMTDFKIKKFALFLSPDNNQFLISDNPITLYNYKPRYGRGNLGTRVDNVEIYFPISPKHCLVFTCPKLVRELNESVIQSKLYKELGYDHSINMDESEKIINCYKYKTPRQLNEDNMEFQNSLQVIHSTRFVYSNENNFNLCKEMINDDESVRKAPLVQSN